MPCGTKIAASTTPATRSERSQTRSYVLKHPDAGHVAQRADHPAGTISHRYCHHHRRRCALSAVRRHVRRDRPPTVHDASATGAAPRPVAPVLLSWWSCLSLTVSRRRIGCLADFLEDVPVGRSVALVSRQASAEPIPAPVTGRSSRSASPEDGKFAGVTGGQFTLTTDSVVGGRVVEPTIRRCIRRCRPCRNRCRIGTSPSRGRRGPSGTGRSLETHPARLRDT